MTSNIRANIEISLQDRARELAEASSRASLQAATELEAEARRALDLHGLGESVLARSLRVASDGEGGAVVITDANHAAFVEFGTTRMQARPFLGRALESLRAVLRRTVLGEVLDAVAKRGSER